MTRWNLSLNGRRLSQRWYGTSKLQQWRNNATAAAANRRRSWWVGACVIVIRNEASWAASERRVRCRRLWGMVSSLALRPRPLAGRSSSPLTVRHHSTDWVRPTDCVAEWGSGRRQVTSYEIRRCLAHRNHTIYTVPNCNLRPWFLQLFIYGP